MGLTLHGRQVESVFQLLGTGETALTAALGFALANTPQLRRALLDDLGVKDSTPDVALESRADEAEGRTDIELIGDDTFVILEAKRGWVVPTHRQLEMYAARGPDLLVVVTDCTSSYAGTLGLPESVDGVPVVHRSWRQIIEVVRSVSGRGQRWTNELLTYLEDTVATLQDRETNWAYCVVLGGIGALNNRHGRDYVDRGVYFHPHGQGGWTKHPPTYMAFRWDNKVHTIRHVDDYELVGDLRGTHALDATDIVTDEADVARPHFVYRLGPHIGPPTPLPSGKNYRAMRLWVRLDTMFTSATLTEAVAVSKSRQ